jgi:hypothetical protein
MSRPRDSLVIMRQFALAVPSLPQHEVIAMLKWMIDYHEDYRRKEVKAKLDAIASDPPPKGRT